MYRQFSHQKVFQPILSFLKIPKFAKECLGINQGKKGFGEDQLKDFTFDRIEIVFTGLSSFSFEIWILL